MKDYLRKYRFKVYIGGVAGAGFNSCTGLSSGSNYTQIREAGALAPINLFDGYKFKPIVLSRGLTRTDNDAYFWWETASRMTTPAALLNMRNIVIEVHSLSGKNLKHPLMPPVKYIVYGAQVEDVRFGDLSADDDNGELIVVQSIVLLHRGIQRVQVMGGII
jgi:phage tail-like protein